MTAKIWIAETSPRMRLASSGPIPWPRKAASEVSLVTLFICS